MTPLQVALSLSPVDKLLSALGGLHAAARLLPQLSEALTAIGNRVALAPRNFMATPLPGHLSRAEKIAEPSNIGISKTGEGLHTSDKAGDRLGSIETRLARQGLPRFGETAIALQTRLTPHRIGEMPGATLYAAAAGPNPDKAHNAAISGIGSRSEWLRLPHNAFDKTTAVTRGAFPMVQVPAPYMTQILDPRLDADFSSRILERATLDEVERRSTSLAVRGRKTESLIPQFRELDSRKLLSAHCDDHIARIQPIKQRGMELLLQMGPRPTMPPASADLLRGVTSNIANTGAALRISSASIPRAALPGLTLRAAAQIAPHPPATHLVRANSGMSARSAPSAPSVTPTITINYSPNISGASPEDWGSAARRHADELLRIIESKLARRARLSFS